MEHRPERGLRRDDPWTHEREQRRRLLGGPPEQWTERDPHPGRAWEHERTGGSGRGDDAAWERSPREHEPPRPGYGSAWESQRGYDRRDDRPRGARSTVPYDDEPWRPDGPGDFGERSYAGYGDRSSLRDVDDDRGVSHPDHERMHSRRGPVGASTGRYTGRGPRGYQRSDERIRENVCDLLLEAPHVDASGFDVTVSAGEVTLEGTVPDRRMKRDAEDLVERVAGVGQVHNHLRVQSGPITGAVDSNGHAVR